MSGSARPPGDGESSEAPPGKHQTVAGERTTAAVHRVRSIESRVGNLTALGLVSAVGFALLAWYYSTALRRPARAVRGAEALTQSRAQTEMPLPPLGPIPIEGPPILGPQTAGPHPAAAGSPPLAEPQLPTNTLAALPALSGPVHPTTDTSIDIPSPGWESPAAGPPGAAAAPSPHARAFERRLSGPVFESQSSAPDSPAEQAEGGAVADGPVPAASGPVAASSAGSPSDDLSRWLTPSGSPAALARVLPTRSLLLPKGAFIDCTLETAIDSTLPGMTTCITATDTFGADGKVVLLERGSKLIGETRGEVQQSSSRVFVLWTEARTPTGVVIPLASPGTDELGRAGLPGEVNRHFWQRFGAAILVSIIDAGAQAAVQSGNGTVIYDPTATQDVTSEVLKETISIPPTVVKSEGDRIQVLVARDLDFRSVYELRAAPQR